MFRRHHNKATSQPSKILIKNSEHFSLYFQNIIHYCLEQSLFTDDLKLADVAPAYLHIKRNPKLLKIIVDWQVFFQIYPRYMKDASMI